AMTMADKIVVMKDGIVEQVGPPLSLYDQPANVFVAQFIGSPAMHILTGVVGPSGVAHGDFMLPVPQSVQGRTTLGTQVHYGVRPEHLVLSDAGVPIQVDVVEPTGSDTMIFGRLGETPMVVNIRDRVDVKAGERIFV